MTADRASVEEAVAELRALADAVLDRLDPWLRAAAEAEGGAAACGWCPLCALAAALRGERPELARRLVEHGAGLVALVRSLLEGHEPACTPAGAAEAASCAKFQRIPVRDGAVFR